MRLHSKVPVVALFGLMHLGVSRAGGILRRARCFDDRGIHNRALGESKPLAQEVLVDQGKDVLSELIGFKQVPEVQDRKSTRLNSSHRRCGNQALPLFPTPWPLIVA